MTVESWDQRIANEVPILNERPIPARFTDARPPIPVRARIAWETGGEWIETTAQAWDSRSVLVQIIDPRRRLIGVWVGAGDVTRL